ncbi:hypothetical protein MKW94_027505 [Papaver nudicaule]|uniref:Amine oxidase domain-containing protein n=1 Tax=Papaver nudicaule TaxID=74823 RepID=A0AA41RTT9_PAPNU|nr:hypothetical protein [Papaver nudicaule]
MTILNHKLCISAAKTFSDAGIKDFLVLEATDRIGGRIKKTNFGGVSVELGANWVEGVNGNEVNPIWTMANKIGLKTFYSQWNNVTANIYKQKYISTYISALICHHCTAHKLIIRNCAQRWVL